LGVSFFFKFSGQLYFTFSLPEGTMVITSNEMLLMSARKKHYRILQRRKKSFWDQTASLWLPV